MNQEPLVPPRFAIAASRFLYSPDVPDHLYRTYARITGLAWTTRRYERTPALTIYELAVVCGLSVRNLWRQMQELMKLGLITCEVQGKRPKRMAFYPAWPDGLVDGDEEGRVAEAAPRAGLVTSASLPSASLGTGSAGLAGAASDALDENRQALAEWGVEARSALAQQVAALPHVTPELVRAWGNHLRQRPGIHNLPGLLLHVLQQPGDPPDAPPAPVSPSPASSLQASLPEPLPAGGDTFTEDLEQALSDLGWSGDDAWAEVAGVVARQGQDFVWAWVEYVEDHPDLGAGFLRAQLRGSTWPAQKKDAGARERERLWQEWQSPEEAGAPQRLTPREQAMARYGIAPETMQVWEKAQAELALQMTQATYDAWLRGTLLLAVEDGRATLGVRQVQAIDWLQHRLSGTILRTLGRYLDRPVETLAVALLPDDPARAGGHQHE